MIEKKPDHFAATTCWPWRCRGARAKHLTSTYYAQAEEALQEVFEISLRDNFDGSEDPRLAAAWPT